LGSESGVLCKVFKGALPLQPMCHPG
jgi:hypothetical protein